MFLVHDDDPQVIVTGKPPDARTRLTLRLRVQKETDRPENVPAATWLRVGDGARVCFWREGLVAVVEPAEFEMGRYDFCSIIEPRPHP